MRMTIAPPTALIPALTGIRIVPATMIFFYHWLFDATDAWPSVARAIFKQGYLAVAIFFATTGFLFAIRYAQRLDSLHYGRFVWRRLLRIYPLYFSVLTLFAVMLGRPEGIIPKHAGDLLILYAMLQSFFPPLLLAGLQTAWTLTISEMFYLAAPLLLVCLPAHNSFRQWVARVFGLCAIALGIAYLFSQLMAWPGTIIGAPLSYLLFRTILGRVPEFLFGMLAGLVYVRWTAAKSTPTSRVATGMIGLGIVVILGLAILIDSFVPPETNAPLFFVLNAGVAAATAVLLLGLASDIHQRNAITRVLGTRPLVFLGQISYALFLIQLTEPCQWLYWVGLGQLGGIEGRWLRALLLYIASLAISAALHLLIERPFAQLGLKIQQKPVKKFL